VSAGQFARQTIYRIKDDAAGSEAALTAWGLVVHRNAGHDTRAIQGWLDHRSITSTAVYTAGRDCINAMQASCEVVPGRAATKVNG